MMKRAALFPISLLLSSAACSSQADYAEQTGVREAAPATASASANATARATAAAPAAATAASFADNDKQGEWTREFRYDWPAAVAAQPELARELKQERDARLAEEKAQWKDALVDATPGCASCGMRQYGMVWKTVADTPGFLSLSGEFSTYTGGAHGMYGVQSLVWDKAAKRSLDGVELFASPTALDKGLGPKLCAALNKEREKRRGAPVDPARDDEFGTGFDSCQSVKDATVLVGSSNGRAFDRIGIWFGPYVSGPYAEGGYELNFPVDAAVLRAVKPAYRQAFAVRR